MDMEQWIAREIRAGFWTDAEIVEAALAHFADELADEEEVRAIVDRWASAHEEEIKKLGDAPTDCDKLDEAFRALEASGIVARQNFTCCNTCGSYEIVDEIDAAERGGKNVDGYAFYHQQDTESAVEDGSLHIGYGTIDSDECEDVEAIGRRIVEQLGRVGLPCEWDGSITRRILVTLDWKRRRPRIDLPAKTTEEAPSVARAVERWSSTLAEASIRDLAGSVPLSTLVDTLIVFQEIEPAERWIRGRGDLGALCFGASRFRACDPLRARKLYLDALRKIRRRGADAAFDLLHVLLEGVLEDEVASKALHSRVSRLDRTLFGMMTRAWLAALKGDLEQVRTQWTEGRDKSEAQWRADEARVGLAAAAWFALGDEEARAIVLGSTYLSAPAVQMAADRAKVARGEAEPHQPIEILSDPQLQYEEGLISAMERDQQILMRIERERSRTELVAFVNAAIALFRARGEASRSYVAALARGEAAAPLPSPERLAPSESALASALLTLEKPGGERFKRRMAAKRVLCMVTVLGPTAQGRELFQRVLANMNPLDDRIGDHVLLALIAQGYLDRAFDLDRALAERHQSYPEESAALALALANADRPKDALEIVARLPKISTHSEALAQLPALIALVHPDQRAQAAAAMFDAWASMERSIDALRLE